MKLVARLLAASLSAGGAIAQTYPSKPITLVVPLAIGSTSDILSRTIGAELARRLGQPVIVDNRPGAGGLTPRRQSPRPRPTGTTSPPITSGPTPSTTGLSENRG